MKARSAVRSGLVPRQRFIARRILASTYRLVDQVMSEDWHLVPVTLQERRNMLVHLLEPRAADGNATRCIEALQSAVHESERLEAEIQPAAVRRAPLGCRHG